MLAKAEPWKQMNLKSFGQALKKIRTERGMSHKDVADRVGVKRSTIKEWEEDKVTPSNLHLKKLYGTFSNLRFFTMLLSNFDKERLINKAETILKAHKGVGDMPADIWFPPIAGRTEELPDELLHMPRPKTFGENLRRQRLLEGLDLEDVATLLKVTPQAVGSWELDRSNPVMANYVALRDIFPKLADAPAPESLDKPKPDGGKGVTKNLGNLNSAGPRQVSDPITPRGKMLLRAVPTAFDGPFGVTFEESPITDAPPRTQKEEEPAVEAPPPQPTAPKTHADQLAEAGAEYARYQAAMQRDKLCVLTLEVELAQAKKVLAESEELTKLAHDKIIELATKAI